MWMGAAAAAALLAACGQKDKAEETQAADAEPSAQTGAKSHGEERADLPAGFPKMTANYRATYDVKADEGPQKMTLEVAGSRQLRFEMPHPDAAQAAAGATLVGVFDDAKNRYVMFREGESAPKVAVVMPFEEGVFDLFQAWRNENATPTRVGQDTVAGLRCDVWESPPETEGEAANQACITKDGIILKGGEKGAEPTMLATSVDKGRLDAARFAAPTGYEIVDMGPCQTAMQEAMAKAQAGEQPDMAMMAECQALSTKAAAVFGDME
jgi:hypothetical protein